jgi:hypothetical protein
MKSEKPPILQNAFQKVVLHWAHFFFSRTICFDAIDTFYCITFVLLVSFQFSTMTAIIATKWILLSMLFLGGLTPVVSYLNSLEKGTIAAHQQQLLLSSGVSISKTDRNDLDLGTIITPPTAAAPAPACGTTTTMTPWSHRSTTTTTATSTTGMATSYRQAPVMASFTAPSTSSMGTYSAMPLYPASFIHPAGGRAATTTTTTPADAIAGYFGLPDYWNSLRPTTTAPYLGTVLVDRSITH